MLKLLVPSSHRLVKPNDKNVDILAKTALLIITAGGFIKCKLGDMAVDYKSKRMSGSLRFENIPFEEVADELIGNSPKDTEIADLGDAGEYIMKLYTEFNHVLMASTAKIADLKLEQKSLPPASKKEEKKPVEEKKEAYKVNDKRAIQANVKTEKVEAKVEKVGEYPAKDAVIIDEATGGVKYDWGLAPVNLTNYPTSCFLGYLFKNAEGNDQLMPLYTPELVPGDKDSEFVLVCNDEAVATDLMKRIAGDKRLSKIVGLKKDGSTLFNPMEVQTVLTDEADRDFEVALIRSSKKFYRMLQGVKDEQLVAAE